jgi:multidrug efflux system membrane fusion protein
MRIKSSHVIAAGVTLALVGWLASGRLGAGPDAPPASAPEAALAERPLLTVQVRELAAEPVARELVINGKTAPVRAVQVRAETSGRVVELGPARGALVAAGEVLLRLDPRDRAALVAQAEANLRLRAIEHDAAAKLGAKGFQAETQVALARAQLEAARAALEQARLELERAEIRAPFAGVLDLRPVEQGDFLDIGDPVATVVDQDPFLVVGEVSETEVGQLELGMPGRARLPDGRMVEGRLRYVASQADPGTRTFRIELEVPNPAGRFSAGVSAELRLVHQTVPGHRLPPSLLVLNDEGKVGVNAVGPDDRVVFHPAEVVRADADAVWLAGLPDKVRVITVGQGFARPGEQVRPIAAQAPAGGPEQPS